MYSRKFGRSIDLYPAVSVERVMVRGAASDGPVPPGKSGVLLDNMLVRYPTRCRVQVAEAFSSTVLNAGSSTQLLSKLHTRL